MGFFFISESKVLEKLCPAFFWKHTAENHKMVYLWLFDYANTLHIIIIFKSYGQFGL